MPAIDELATLESYVDFVFDDHPTRLSAGLLLFEPSPEELSGVNDLLGEERRFVRIVLWDMTRDATAELTAAVQEAAEILLPSSHISTTHRIDTRAFVVSTDRTVPSDFRAEIAGAVGLPSGMSIQVSRDDTPKEACSSSSPGKTGGVMEGGRRLSFCGNQGICTSGFAVRRTSNTSQTGILTAAHCGGFLTTTSEWYHIRYANGVDPYSSLRHYDEMTYTLGDIEFNRKWYASASVALRVYMYGQYWKTITGFQYQNPVNSYVCAKGANTAHEVNHEDAVMCGRITSNMTVIYTAQTASCSTCGATVDYTNTTIDDNSLTPRGGDSGSPIWLAGTGTALGLHEGGSGTNERYTKVGNALNSMYLELVP